MSVAGLLTPQSATAGYNPSPVISTNAETFGATVDFMRTNMNIDASLRLTGNAYRDRDESIRREFGQDPLDITGIKKKYTNPTAEGRVKMLQENQKLLDNWIMQGRKDNPDKFGKIKTSAEVEESAREVARVSKRQYEDILSRNPNGFGRTAASLGGGIAGALTDPLNIATMAFGAGAGKTILQAALIEGSINAATELASQPFVSQWQKELGHKYGLGEAAGNVAFAFAGGAAFTTVARGLVPAVRNSYEVAGSVSQRVLERIAESEHLPASVRNAATYMSRVAHIDESAPPGRIKEEADIVRHREKVKELSEDFNSYKPTKLPTSEAGSVQIDKLKPSMKEAVPKIETPQFKNWFGESKVTDDKGAPLVVYHGTNDDIAKFDITHRNRKDNGWLGRGVYTTSDPELASMYTQIKVGDAPNVIPMYAAIKKPYKATLETKQKFRNAPQYEIDEFTEGLKAKGHDGVILEYPDGTKEIVAFKPEQVKSVFNPGTWDPKDTRLLDAGMDVTDLSSNPPPLKRPAIEVKDMDRLQSKRATFDQIMKEDPNMKITLEDGSQTTLKELAKTVDDDLAVIEAMTSCRIG